MAGALKLFLSPLAKKSTQSMAAFTQLTFESEDTTLLSSFATGRKSPCSILGTEALTLSTSSASRLLDHFCSLRPDQNSARSGRTATGSERSKASIFGSSLAGAPAPAPASTPSSAVASPPATAAGSSSPLSAFRGFTCWPSFWEMRASTSFFRASLAPCSRTSRMTPGWIQRQNSAVSSLAAPLTLTSLASNSFGTCLSSPFTSRALDP